MLLIVNPATNATPERSFSLARNVFTWNRLTLTQSRFNSVSLLHYHKSFTDTIDLLTVGNDFISKYDERKRIFGKFTPSDFS